MGTQVECLLDVPPADAVDRAFGAVEAELARLERMLSRFRPESELSVLNSRGRLRVGDELRELDPGLDLLRAGIFG